MAEIPMVDTGDGPHPDQVEYTCHHECLERDARPDRRQAHDVN